MATPDSIAGVTTHDQPGLITGIKWLVKSKKLYLEHNLKVANLSSELGLGVSYISQVINQNKGHSFNDYINHYRVETVQEKIKQLADTGGRVLPKDLGYEAGFGSGSTFYKALATAFALLADLPVRLKVKMLLWTGPVASLFS